MLGIDIDRDGQSIVDEVRNRGFLINCTNTTVLRLLPPYIIQQDHVNQLFFELGDVFRTLK